MEKIENIGFGDLKLIQSEDGFKFGIDAVIAADFTNALSPNSKMIIDLGTGNGIIPMILAYKNPKCSIIGVDVRDKAIDMAKRSAILNTVDDRVSFISADICALRESHHFLGNSADTVVFNPPYVARGSGLINEKNELYVARQETTAGIEEFIATAAWLLKDRGHLFMVHRPSRLVDIFYFCRKHKLEPKDIRLVSPGEGKKPNIVLLHCVFDGGHELNFMDELIVYDLEGNYSPEIFSIYEKQVEKISISCNNSFAERK